MEKPLCMKCLGAGVHEVRPDQLGYLHRPELEIPSMKWNKTRVYEQPDGLLQVMQPPYKLMMRCRTCKPRGPNESQRST